MTNRILNGLRRLISIDPSAAAGVIAQGTPREYWTEHNVTSHHEFATPQGSLEYFHWRNDQYFNYIELMPVAGFDGQRVMDYGCGPGHDLVGFGTFSTCAHLVGVDVSSSSVAESRARMALHGIAADVILLEADTPTLPFEDGAFDHIHSSGVLHHTPDPVGILRELRRVLRPGGTANVMVYNYDSLWMHLYVAYQRTIVQGLYPGQTQREQFKRSTDGDQCPISNCYRHSEWISVCEEAGFQASYSGAAISVFELSLLQSRFAAIMERRLPAESREFLKALEFDRRGVPTYRGQYAGIDACYRLLRRS
jgi:SAM-dependent methyltransferase